MDNTMAYIMRFYIPVLLLITALRPCNTHYCEVYMSFYCIWCWPVLQKSM